MRIANPLYDHAFKYLMSNDRLARKMLSVILEKEVLELELAQQAIVIEDRERRFTLFRLDFKAECPFCRCQLAEWELATFQKNWK